MDKSILTRFLINQLMSPYLTTSPVNSIHRGLLVCMEEDLCITEEDFCVYEKSLCGKKEDRYVMEENLMY